MRDLFWQISVTLDGMFEGPGGDLSDTAEVMDPDFARYIETMLASIDGMILGRKTYEAFLQYWPTAEGLGAEPMNALPKWIGSRSPRDVGSWNGCRALTGDVASQVEALKREPGRDLAIFGSADLGQFLLRAGLVDELRLMVTPVVLGRGNRLFAESPERVGLRLAGVEPWSSGVVHLRYRKA